VAREPNRRLAAQPAATYGWSESRRCSERCDTVQRPQQRHQTSWCVILAAVEFDITETAHCAAFNYRAGKTTRA